MDTTYTKPGPVDPEVQKWHQEVAKALEYKSQRKMLDCVNESGPIRDDSQVDSFIYLLEHLAKIQRLEKKKPQKPVWIDHGLEFYVASKGNALDIYNASRKIYTYVCHDRAHSTGKFSTAETRESIGFRCCKIAVDQIDSFWPEFRPKKCIELLQDMNEFLCPKANPTQPWDVLRDRIVQMAVDYAKDPEAVSEDFPKLVGILLNSKGKTVGPSTKKLVNILLKELRSGAPGLIHYDPISVVAVLQRVKQFSNPRQQKQCDKLLVGAREAVRRHEERIKNPPEFHPPDYAAKRPTKTGWLRRRLLGKDL